MSKLFRARSLVTALRNYKDMIDYMAYKMVVGATTMCKQLGDQLTLHTLQDVVEDIITPSAPKPSDATTEIKSVTPEGSAKQRISTALDNNNVVIGAADSNLPALIATLEQDSNIGPNLPANMMWNSSVPAEVRDAWADFNDMIENPQNIDKGKVQSLAQSVTTPKSTKRKLEPDSVSESSAEIKTVNREAVVAKFKSSAAAITKINQRGLLFGQAMRMFAELAEAYTGALKKAKFIVDGEEIDGVQAWNKATRLAGLGDIKALTALLNLKSMEPVFGTNPPVKQTLFEIFVSKIQGEIDFANGQNPKRHLDLQKKQNAKRQMAKPSLSEFALIELDVDVWKKHVPVLEELKKMFQPESTVSDEQRFAIALGLFYVISHQPGVYLPNEDLAPAKVEASLKAMKATFDQDTETLRIEIAALELQISKMADDIKADALMGADDPDDILSLAVSVPKGTQSDKETQRAGLLKQLKEKEDELARKFKYFTDAMERDLSVKQGLAQAAGARQDYPGTFLSSAASSASSPTLVAEVVDRSDLVVAAGDVVSDESGKISKKHAVAKPVEPAGKPAVAVNQLVL